MLLRKQVVSVCLPLFSYIDTKKIFNNVLCNIKITIFARKIKADSAQVEGFYGMSNLNLNENVEGKSWRNCWKNLERTE